jgi:hypothetical protein
MAAGARPSPSYSTARERRSPCLLGSRGGRTCSRGPARPEARNGRGGHADRMKAEDGDGEEGEGAGLVSRAEVHGDGVQEGGQTQADLRYQRGGAPAGDHPKEDETVRQGNTAECRRRQHRPALQCGQGERKRGQNAGKASLQWRKRRRAGRRAKGSALSPGPTRPPRGGWLPSSAVAAAAPVRPTPRKRSPRRVC